MRGALGGWVLILAVAAPAWGQAVPIPDSVAESPVVNGTTKPVPILDSATVTPGPGYHAGWFTRFLVGSGYRDLWTTPVRVPVIDLDRFAGGVTVLKRGATGGQTWSLHVRGADGNEYTLRSVDKHVKLNPEVGSGTVAWLLRDQISAGLATGALIVAPLLRAAQVPHVEPTLVVLPDSPRLGEYRRQFAGLLVWVEARPRDNVVRTDRVMREISGKVTERFDSRAYLRARLMDIVVGDWDRGRLQWWYQRSGPKRDHLWTPIPHDRDWAFANHDGLLYDLIRPNVPWFVTYKPKYPALLGLEAQAWGEDRRYLQDLEKPAWDSVAQALHAALTDSVIDDAVAHLPPAQQQLFGERLRQALRGRRDAIPSMASSFYHTVAGQADVHLVKVPSIVDIRRWSDTVEIRARTRDDATVYYTRRFARVESREVRLYLDGGPDSVTMSGSGDGIMVRLIAGADGNVLVEHREPASGPTRVYDGGHPLRVLAGEPAVDSRSYETPKLPADVLEPERQPVAYLLRDAGSNCVPVSTGQISSVAGVSVETGYTCDAYGFRRIPFAIEQTATVGYTFGPAGIIGHYTGTLRATGGSPLWSLRAFGTSAEYTWFYGIGNNTPRTLDDNDHRARQSHFELAPSVSFLPTDHLTLTVGPELRYWDTERSPLFFAQTVPYGSGPFGTLSAAGSVVYDSRSITVVDSAGFRVALSGRGVPAWWNADHAYATGHAEAAGFVILGTIPTTPTLVGRLGADKVWGTAPFQDLASIGSPNVRGFFPGRFTGQAAVYQQSQILFTLAHATIVAPANLGVLALNNVGRAFASGEHSTQWHDAYGGGLWGSFLGRRYLITLTIAHSPERNVISAGFGIGW